MNFFSKKKEAVDPTVCWKVFFDVAVDNLDAGRIEMDLFCETPKTS